MENILLISAIILSGFNAYGAVPTARSSASVSGARTATGRSATSNNTVSQTATRSAVASRSAPTSTPSSTVRGRSAVAPASATRAAKQSVISTGTKVAAATQNTAVDQVCWEKFSGCMDSFCMLDNANGGRCICSDKNAEYDAILAEIQALDEQSYQMATVGVERIEMGDSADAVMKRTQEITKSIEKDAEKAKSKRQSLDLSAWNINSVDFDADVEDMFSITSDGISIEGKTGDALYRVSAKLCNAQVPECASQAKMMELMYQQRVRSDCTAYENSLRQQRTQSAQKLAAAQSAMREAALEQYRNANKYDLGQCTLQFKQCMQTTGGCGEDFIGCVEYSVREGLVNNGNKTKTIKGTSSKITLSAETYDVLESKKELCMNVTQQCVNVRDQVWDTFLREVAPQVKSAELIVESNMRTSCIANISSCFQKACRENMDPNDPDGSYDMCLTRPETLRSACKVEIDPCEGGIPNIMEYVRARLASMRVDSCTREFKACLTSEDRCGKDYTQCIGLDTDTIVKMCTDDKLPGCYYEYKNDQKSVQDTLAEIATGIFLNIDNNMLTACQKAVQSKVIEVCGSLSECDAFTDDDIIGTDSLISYKDSVGNTVIDGLMNFGLLKIKSDGSDIDKTDYTQIYNGDGTLVDNNQTKQRIASSINNIVNKVKQKIGIIENDITIDRCVNGRDQRWAGETGNSNKFDRFPNLLDSYKLMIFNSGLDKAYLNYHKKYTELVTQALEDQNDDVKSMLCAAMSYNAGSVYCSKYGVGDDNEPVCEQYSTYPEMESIFQEGSGRIGSLGRNEIINSGNDDLTGLTNNGLSYVIKGADIATKLNNMSKGKGEFIQTDNKGNMIGKISMTSVYSPSTNVCTVTTTTTICSEIEKVITKNKNTCFNTINVIGGSCNSGGIIEIGTHRAVTTEEYHGTVCTDFADPVITTNPIQM